MAAADIAWLLTASALVLFMTLPGLALFYGGLVRAKNVLSVLMHCFMLAAVMSVAWVVIGFSLAFHGSGQWSAVWATCSCSPPRVAMNNCWRCSR